MLFQIKDNLVSVMILLSRQWCFPTLRASARSRDGFTLVEVLVATLLIAMAIGSIMTMNARAISTLRESREAAASSQVLQQRIEMIRDRPWAEVSSAPAMAAMLGSATESEPELADPQFVETMKVSVTQAGTEGPSEGDRSFRVRRVRGRAIIEQAGDFSTEHTLLFETEVTWHPRGRVLTRALRAFVCRQGLTRSGILGSTLGRPGSERSGP